MNSLTKNNKGTPVMLYVELRIRIHTAAIGEVNIGAILNGERCERIEERLMGRCVKKKDGLEVSD